MTDTIYQGMKMRLPDGAPEARKRQNATVRKLILEDTFGGRFEDQAHAIQVFNQHADAVREAIPPERLLVYDVAQGWEPLCRFLDVAQPDEPFPRLNDTAAIQTLMKQMQTAGGVLKN